MNLFLRTHSQSQSVMFSSAVIYLAPVYFIHFSIGFYEWCVLFYYAVNDLVVRRVSLLLPRLLTWIAALSEAKPQPEHSYSE